MRGAFFKTVLRTAGSNAGRLLAVTAIVMLGIGFVSGLGTISPLIESSVSAMLTERAAPDVIVKSTLPTGMSEALQDRLASLPGVAAAEAVTQVDLEIEGQNGRVCVADLSGAKVNKLELLAGRFPQSADEVLVERSSEAIAAVGIGERLSLLGAEREVVGIVANPLIFVRDGEPDNEGEPLGRMVYLDSAYLRLPITDLYVRAADLPAAGVFADSYRERIAELVDALTAEAGDSCVFLTLEDNKSCALTENYADKINGICLIFPVFFIAVTALVVLTTMTRLTEEERPVIGCYRTLGLGDAAIAAKYVGLSLLCGLVGSAAGVLLGIAVLPTVIYPAFNAVFFMPARAGAPALLPGLLAAAAMLAAVGGVTFWLVFRELREQPAALLRPKAPKAGRKIFLEHLPFLWKRLKFKYKSTFRNIFRYGKHLAMTVVSVAGSTALVLAGFGLSDLSRDSSADAAAGMADSFGAISAVVIVFAALLCVLVIFNLTNMNIGERRREIATLKVLGYQESEVAGYIYREILIMTLFGIALGLPLGYGLLRFVFAYLEFGSIQSVRWVSYLCAAGLVLLSVGLVDLLLRPKMKKIDMTASLKAVE